MTELKTLDDLLRWAAAINLAPKALSSLPRLRSKLVRLQAKHGNITGIRHGIEHYDGHAAGDGDDVEGCPPLWHAWAHLTFGGTHYFELHLKLDGPCTLN